jgi:hypothetical protein
MRKFAICLTAVLFLIALVSGSSAEEKKGAETTVTGYITDSHCKDHGALAGHRDCALKCAKEKGAKLGIWDAEKSRFLALDDQEKAEEFAGEQVTVKGVVDESTGTIKVASIAKTEKKAS